MWNFFELHIFGMKIRMFELPKIEFYDKKLSKIETKIDFRHCIFNLFFHFRDDPRFLTSRDKAFKRVVNDTSIFRLELPGRPGQQALSHKAAQPESKCPELLANYCDMLLRKTPLSKKLTSDEVEAKLRDVLLVLKYVQNKDVFMIYTKAHLTRRLILGTSADSEKEENMVEWLREVGMPADFINKLSRMFQDIKVSEDLNAQFKDHLTYQAAKQNLADSVCIKILNVAAWARTTERVPVTLPRELEDYIPEVEEFYKVTNSSPYHTLFEIFIFVQKFNFDFPIFLEVKNSRKCCGFGLFSC